MSTDAREAFVKRWAGEWMCLGMDVLNVLSGPRDLREHKAEAVLRLPGQIKSLLLRIYDDLQPKTAANGQPPAAKGFTNANR